MKKEDKKDIREITLEELTQFFVLHSEKPFRAKQIHDWLWKKAIGSFDEMTNLSVELRELLTQTFDFKTATVFKELTSTDGTIKTAFHLHDNAIIEGVLIPFSNRATACISSQVGCALACSFCATGKLGFKRDLSYTEIFDQVALLSRQANEKYKTNLSNIVFMGMGEPLLNYSNVMRAIQLITSPDTLNISPSRITLSTVGITKMIRKLADDKVKFNLAISLHAASDAKRNMIIPINKTNPLNELSDALVYFYEKTGSRITLEYLILEKFNNTMDDAKQLAAFCKAFPCKINIIEYNKVPGTSYEKANENSVREFSTFLESRNLIVNIRRSRGEDIGAACGQLAGKLIN